MIFSTSGIMVSALPTQKDIVMVGWFAARWSVLYVIFQLLEKQLVLPRVVTTTFVQFVAALGRYMGMTTLTAIRGSGVQMQSVAFMLKILRRLKVRRREMLF
jgi:hypothetical protein